MIDHVCIVKQTKKAISQYIRLNNEINFNEILGNLSRTHYKSVSTSKIVVILMNMVIKMFYHKELIC